MAEKASPLKVAKDEITTDIGNLVVPTDCTQKVKDILTKLNQKAS